MTTITEIIPDDFPDWAKQAMDEGQFFNKVCEMIKEADNLNRRFFSAGFSQGYGSEPDDINRVDELFDRTASILNN